MHAQHGEEDVMKMGGLRKKLPITHAAYLVYCLAISGIPPFAGFFSKDAILSGAWSFGSLEVAGVVPETIVGWPTWLGHAIYLVGLVAAACTAFYMFRSYFLVFSGSFRGDHHVYDHAHESPPAMAWPLILLAVGSVVVGFLGVPEVFHAKNWFDEWLIPSVFPKPEAVEAAGHASLEIALMLVAIVVSTAGIALAWALYGRGISPAAEKLATAMPRAYRLVFNKYYVDEAYDFLFVRPLQWLANWPLAVLVDRYLIDGLLVNGTAKVIDVSGRLVRLLQSGDVQRGIVGVAVGATSIVMVGSNWTAWRASTITRVAAAGQNVTVWTRGAPPGTTRPLEYRFDFGDETPPVVQPSSSASHRYESGGKHKVKVTVTDPRWKSSSTSTVTVNAAAEGASR
jgi:NADH-quinone oxidoreductase subunit L